MSCSWATPSLLDEQTVAHEGAHQMSFPVDDAAAVWETPSTAAQSQPRMGAYAAHAAEVNSDKKPTSEENAEVLNLHENPVVCGLYGCILHRLHRGICQPAAEGGGRKRKVPTMYDAAPAPPPRELWKAARESGVIPAKKTKQPRAPKAQARYISLWCDWQE